MLPACEGFEDCLGNGDEQIIWNLAMKVEKGGSMSNPILNNIICCNVHE